MLGVNARGPGPARGGARDGLLERPPCLFVVIAAGVQRRRAEARVLEHQRDLDDEERRVEHDEAREAQVQIGCREARRGQVRRQDARDRPRLAAHFGDDPAELGGEPRQRNRPHRIAQEPAAVVLQQLAARAEPERGDEGREEQEAEEHHDAEREEHGRDGRNRLLRRGLDLVRRRVGHVLRELLEHQAVAEILLVLIERRLRLGARVARLQLLQRAVRDHAALDVLLAALGEFAQADHRLADRARRDEAERVRDLDRVIGALRLLVRQPDQRERRGRGLRFPFGFDRGELHLLHFARRVARFVAEHDHAERRREAEARGDRERAQREVDVALLQQIPRGHAEHEHRGRHVARRHRVHELHLRDRVEEHVEQVRELHAHRLVVELGADRIVHPAVRDEDPQRGQVRAERDEERDDQMLDLRQPVPAEEEQADERRFEEERHQPFDGERHAEDVADVVRVVRPVRAELEFERDARRHAHREVDPEELAPELGHVLVDLLARHHVDGFHDDEQPGHAERERNEQEMVERCDAELQTRQIDDFATYHGGLPQWVRMASPTAVARRRRQAATTCARPADG